MRFVAFLIAAHLHPGFREDKRLERPILIACRFLLAQQYHTYTQVTVSPITIIRNLI